MVEVTGGFCGRNHQQRGADIPLVAVAGTVHNGNVVRTLLLSVKGGRATAVQLQYIHTACIQHNLSGFVISSTSGEGLLTAIENHKDNLAISRDAYHSTGATAGAGFVMKVHAVLSQDVPAAYRFHDSAGVGVIIGGTGDNRRAIIQNRKEIVATNAVKGGTFHHQQATGLTGIHIVEAGIYAQHSIVVFNIVCRVLRVGVLVLSRNHLLADP